MGQPQGPCTRSINTSSDVAGHIGSATGEFRTRSKPERFPTRALRLPLVANLDTFKGRIQLLNAGDDFDGGDLQTPGSHTEYTRIPQVRQSGQVIPLFFLVSYLEGKGDDFLFDQPFPAVFLGLAMGCRTSDRSNPQGVAKEAHLSRSGAEAKGNEQSPTLS